MAEMEHSYILRKNNFIKILIFFGFLLIFTSCASIPVEREWQDIIRVRYRTEKLEVGDIIVKNKIVKDPLGWYGHAAMVVKEDTIGDYPKLGVGYYEIDTYSWLYEDRKVMVLRYKHFDEKFKKLFVENLKKHTDKGYFISSRKNTNSFYCSKYVWYIYYITAKELGYELDLDNDGGFMVFPYDFIGTEELEQVIF
ncbi:MULTISPECIES: hypothetical protein [Psychrilyobacter]|nr:MULTISPECIES: hypothetical protein [Psychrilyobacter]MCS5420406.1 hypothetical protein [Psychrilyobacter sp. S5]NDI76416.1 hypothetical protein [Psychrilyobacter piezotolerans]